MNPFSRLNTNLVMRAAVPAQELGLFPEVLWCDFPRILGAEGLKLEGPVVIGGVVTKVGADPEQLPAAADDQAVKDKLRASSEEAVRRGAFAAPTFFVGEEMFWGNDRLDFVERALRAADARSFAGLDVVGLRNLREPR